jgi:hypothetical protein
MADDDLDLYDSSSPTVPPPTSPSFVPALLALGLVALAGGTAVWFYLHRAPATPAAVVAPAASTPAQPPAALGTQPEAIDIPPLDASDNVVRDLLHRLSGHPVVAAWAAGEGLLRHLAAAIENVAGGQVPSAHVQALRPSAPFRVTTDGGRTVIDPRSYARYDGIAEALDSINPEVAARLYSTVKPRLGDAVSELGEAPGSLDASLERAIVTVLQTPDVADPVVLVPKGATAYAFADQRLENLAPAQKQLLRMGPTNARRIKASLRRIAVALGIPTTRLPPT